MMYPVWEVPVLGSGWMIGLTATLHVFISHFAIGGGAFLAFTEHLAYKKNDQRIYNWLKKHALFFLLLTTVLGTVSGVGIWWSTGLANPAGIGTLLQNFSMFWAVEYLFFAAELVTFFVWYYTYGRIPKKTHLNIAWTYFGISFFTLVVINGILTFMLTSGTWPETQQIWDGWMNPGFWPALFIRLFIMFALGGIYAFVTGSRIEDKELKSTILQWSAKWVTPALLLGPIMIVWYFFTLPQATLDVIFQGLTTIGEGNFSIMARVVFLTIVLAASLLLMTLTGPYMNPKGFSPRFAAFMLATAFLFMLGEEWSREMMRKPYVVYNYMYSNSLRKTQIDDVNKVGYFPSSTWAKAELANLPHPSTKDMGKLMFRYQCMSCHSPGAGYRSMPRLLGERDEQAINSLLDVVSEAHKADNPYNGIMPPVVGTSAEKKALASYLVTLTKDYQEPDSTVADASL